MLQLPGLGPGLGGVGFVSHVYKVKPGLPLFAMHLFALFGYDPVCWLQAESANVSSEILVPSSLQFPRMYRPGLVVSKHVLVSNDPLSVPVEKEKRKKAFLDEIRNEREKKCVKKK